MRYLDDLLYKIENWTPQPDWSDKVAYDKERQKDKLLGIVNHLVNTRGKTSVAESINENAEIIYQIANRIMYETYSNNTVYYPPARYYDPSEDYIRIEEAVGEGVFSLQDIEKLNENY